MAYTEPHVATRPKNTNTNNSPNPKYPYGLGPPVYNQPAAIHKMPTGINARVVAKAINRPNTAATPNAMNAAIFTFLAGTSPDPTNRSGPTR